MEEQNKTLSMTLLMTPNMANFSGYVHGGAQLRLLDQVAYACASRYAGAYVVTVSVDQVVFRQPIHVGELVTFLASVNVLTMVILGGIGSIPGVIVGAVVVTILNLQVLQSISLWLAQLRQSDAFIPIINFHWKDLSNQLDPSKYQRLVFGIILVLMMIYRPAGILPAGRRQRELEHVDSVIDDEVDSSIAPGAASSSGAVSKGKEDDHV